MYQLIKIIKSPLHWFVWILLLSSLLKLNQNQDYQQFIRSDGRGYYAYLPATFLYNDPSFQKSVKAELKNAPWKGDPLYLYPTDEGHVYNKYFPGIAILQTPFFGLACLTAWISRQPIDGYSDIFHFWYYFGSTLYAFLAIFLFRRCMREMFPNHVQAIDWWIPYIYLSTTLLFYSFETPSFTHHYSFFLFSLACVIGIKLKRRFSIQQMFFLGLVLGLIFLVRPTNILFLLFLPFLFESKTTFVSFFRKIFENYLRGFILFTLGFLLITSLLFLLWKWESGSWILWSYSGEGFTFSSPKIWQNLFSWRIGLLIHTPLFFLFFVALIYLWKRNSFHFFTILFYFGTVLYVISSWWCWDYESPFGNRPLTEHAAFLLIPVFAWLTFIKKRYAIALMVTFSFIGIIRFYQIKSGALGDQRFISGKAYFSSLAFWNEKNYARYNFGRSCVPLGKLEEEKLVLSVLEITHFNENDLFGVGNELILPPISNKERFYYRINLEKQQNNSDFNDVYIVIDAYSMDSLKRYYKAIPLYHDRFEAKKEWKDLEFNGLIEDNFKVFRKIKMYLWNPGRRTFKVKNVRFVLERYCINYTL